MNAEEFLTARLTEFLEWLDVEFYEGTLVDSIYYNARAMAKSQLKIAEFHKAWPVMVTTKPDLSAIDVFDFKNFGDIYTARISQQIAFFTQEEYRRVFSDEPATAPMIKEMLKGYENHPEFKKEWL